MEVFNKLNEIGYSVEPWSSWEGDKGKFGVCKGLDGGPWVALLNTNNNTLEPCHGFYGGYLKNIAKYIDYKLIKDTVK